MSEPFVDPLVQAEQILRTCYMGEMPVDPWIIMAQALIATGIRNAYKAGLTKGLDIASGYAGEGVQIQKDLRREITKIGEPDGKPEKSEGQSS